VIKDLMLTGIIIPKIAKDTLEKFLIESCLVMTVVISIIALYP
jgi:hypothetical protein